MKLTDRWLLLCSPPLSHRSLGIAAGSSLLLEEQTWQPGSLYWDRLAIWQCGNRSGTPQARTEERGVTERAERRRDSTDRDQIINSSFPLSFLFFFFSSKCSGALIRTRFGLFFTFLFCFWGFLFSKICFFNLSSVRRRTKKCVSIVWILDFFTDFFFFFFFFEHGCVGELQYFPGTPTRPRHWLFLCDAFPGGELAAGQRRCVFLVFSGKLTGLETGMRALGCCFPRVPVVFCTSGALMSASESPV